MKTTHPSTTRLNVLHLLSSSGYYGAERWVVALANNLNRTEVNCELAVMYDGAGPPSELVENFPAPVADQHHFYQRSKFDPTVIWTLRELINQQSIDIICSHGYKSDLVALPAARLAGIRCVSTPHGFGSGLSWKMRMYIRLGVMSLRRFDKVVPLSATLFQMLLEQGVSQDKLQLIENSVDLGTIDAMVPASHQNGPNGKVRIGYVGRLVDGKQVDHIIRVFASLLNERNRDLKEFELYIVGDGPDRASLELLADELGCGNNVVFTGFVEDGLSLLRTLSLFVMASNSEGIPRCVMEAFALRVPVAAYDIPGVSDLIEDGVTGRLATLNDIAGLADCCRQMLEKKHETDSMVTNARKTIEQRFSAQRMAEEYTALYRELTQ